MIPAYIVYILAFIIPLIVGITIYPLHIRFMLRKGKYGVDIHKKEKPKVAEMGGLIILLAIFTGILVTSILVPEKAQRIQILIFGLTILIAGGIGIIDDFYPLNAIQKPLLLLLAAVPIIVSGIYVPEPMLPFIGKTRLTIVYVILLPIVFSVTSNAVNMLDVYNGSMASTTNLILVASLIANGIIFGFKIVEVSVTNILILLTLGAIIAFWIYNKYPAKVFAGDTGSLAIGAALGAIAVLGRLEVVVIIAMIPLIMNGYGIISSVKGLKERREMTRPTSMTEKWEIQAASDEKAPITLAGLVLQNGPMKEKDIVKAFSVLTFISSILAIITALLIPGGLI